jgi:hypothetical protein
MMRRREFITLLASEMLLARIGSLGQSTYPDISSVPPDLTVPPIELGPPGPGKRVRQVLAEYKGTEIHHALYLPIDWRSGASYPVIVEYSGNGPFTSPYGDYSSGDVDGSKLGYGITGGRGFLWLTLPCINANHTANQLWWWGDVDATLDYCHKAIAETCTQFGGDSSSIMLCGFSRGAIAVNFLGLHNDAIADIWLGFITCSHYDGVEKWNWEGSDRKDALTRLARLSGRATFVEQEGSEGFLDNIKKYLRSSGVKAPFTFCFFPFRNHTDAWVLCDLPQRRKLRHWLSEVLKNRPGTYAIHGKVLNKNDDPIPGAEILSGLTHYTRTGKDGKFFLRGLVRGEHSIQVKAPSNIAKEVIVTIKGANTPPVDVQLS